MVVHGHRPRWNDGPHLCFKGPCIVEAVDHEVVGLARACNQACDPSTFEHTDFRVLMHADMRSKRVQKSLFLTGISMRIL